MYLLQPCAKIPCLLRYESARRVMILKVRPKVEDRAAPSKIIKEILVPCQRLIDDVLKRSGQDYSIVGGNFVPICRLLDKLLSRSRKRPVNLPKIAEDI